MLTDHEKRELGRAAESGLLSFGQDSAVVDGKPCPVLYLAQLRDPQYSDIPFACFEDIAAGLGYSCWYEYRRDLASGGVRKRILERQ